jgi:ribosomal protein S18 acetylase RimI-like enzyme
MVTDGDEQHPGITIRPASPADAASIATVHVASWRESYAGMLPEAMLLALSIAERTERWRGILGEASSMEGTAVFVAEREGQTVGFASGGAWRDCGLHAQGLTGEISAIYVLQSAQREGVGRRLMKAVAHALSERGHRSASLWVLRDNQPARSFYETLGGVVVAEKEDHREGVVLIEVAYAWRNLAALSSMPNQKA